MRCRRLSPRRSTSPRPSRPNTWSRARRRRGDRPGRRAGRARDERRTAHRSRRPPRVPAARGCRRSRGSRVRRPRPGSRPLPAAPSPAGVQWEAPSRTSVAPAVGHPGGWSRRHGPHGPEPDDADDESGRQRDRGPASGRAGSKATARPSAGPLIGRTVSVHEDQPGRDRRRRRRQLGDEAVAEGRRERRRGPLERIAPARRPGPGRRRPRARRRARPSSGSRCQVASRSSGRIGRLLGERAAERAERPVQLHGERRSRAAEAPHSSSISSPSKNLRTIRRRCPSESRRTARVSMSRSAAAAKGRERPVVADLLGVAEDSSLPGRRPASGMTAARAAPGRRSRSRRRGTASRRTTRCGSRHGGSP